MPASSPLFWTGEFAGLVCALLGIAVAWMSYGARQPRFAPTRNPLIVLLRHRYYVDELYSVLLVKPVIGLGVGLRRGLEGATLDGGSRGLAALTGWVGLNLRRLQTGYVRTYALGIFMGATVIVVYLATRP